MQDGIFMIHPEFVTEDGSVRAEGAPVPWTGVARMWILNPQMRIKHHERICEGVNGYFMEGSRRVELAAVTKVLGLYTNPVL